LLDRFVAAKPVFFETLIIDLMIAMGYGGSAPQAGQRLGRSGDGGVDGLINEDVLGLDTIYLQAKRHLKDIWLSNRVFADLDAVVDACCRAWNALLLGAVGEDQNITELV
jgi:restriction system protein